MVLFADHITGSIQALLDVTEFRRARQIAYNEEHGITPKSVVRAVQESLHVVLKSSDGKQGTLMETPGDFDLHELIAELERDMVSASASLEYERAALLRDQIMELKNRSGLSKIEPKSKPATYPRPGRKKQRA